jgi:protein-S-isoprenylcysteine O-methyltransferase Ste14
MKKRIRIQGTLIFLAIILLILFARFIIPSWKKEPLEDFFDISGIILVLSGFLLRIIARGHKEEISQGGNKLVTDGPYCLIRNPMYFGTLLIGTGIISILLNFWALSVFLIIYLLIYVPQISREEKILLKRFGEDYEKYRNHTPKYFPSIIRLLNFRSYIPLLKFSWVKKEWPALTATVTAIFIIEIWQDVKLFGVEEFFDEFLEFFLIIIVFIAAIFILNHNKYDK